MDNPHIKHWLEGLLSAISGNAFHNHQRQAIHKNAFSRTANVSHRHWNKSQSLTNGSSPTISPRSALSGSSMVQEEGMLNGTYDFHAENDHGRNDTRINPRCSRGHGSTSQADNDDRNPTYEHHKMLACSPIPLVRDGSTHVIATSRSGSRRPSDAAMFRFRDTEANLEVESFSNPIVTTTTGRYARGSDDIGHDCNQLNNLRPPTLNQRQRQPLQRRPIFPSQHRNVVERACSDKPDLLANTCVTDDEQTSRDLIDWIQAGNNNEAQRIEARHLPKEEGSSASENRYVTPAIQVAPPNKCVRTDVVDDEAVTANAEHYDRATWRMYHRITNARIAAQHNQCFVPMRRTAPKGVSVFGDTGREVEDKQGSLQNEHDGVDIGDQLRESAQYGVFALDLERDLE